MNPLQDPEDLRAATALINQYAASDWVAVGYVRHAREALAKRYVAQGVVELVLRSGVVTSFRTKLLNGALQYRYRVRYVDKYGAVNVVTVIPGFHKLRVITVFPDESDDDTW